jgi:DNA-directed RNA polymerase specialized sigma24 family protein
MSSAESVTQWLEHLQDGDRASVRLLWERYFRRLVGLARAKLKGAPRRAADAEDVALSAFDSFCRGAEQGRFPRLQDRDNLWRLLATLTVCKAYRLARDEQCGKRGGGAVVEASALSSSGPGVEGLVRLEEVIGREPTPELAAQMVEDCQRLLSRLGDDELRRIALWKMEGYTNAEVAERLQCAPATVERRLQVIRLVWAHEGDA